MMKKNFLVWTQNIGIFALGMVVAFFVVDQTYTNQTASIADVFVGSTDTEESYSDLIWDRSENNRGILVFNEIGHDSLSGSILRVEFVASEIDNFDPADISSFYPYSYTIDDDTIVFMIEITQQGQSSKTILQWSDIIDDIVLHQIAVFDGINLSPLVIKTLSSSGGNHQ